MQTLTMLLETAETGYERHGVYRCLTGKKPNAGSFKYNCLVIVIAL